MDTQVIRRFSDLFQGLHRVYGTYATTGSKDERGKMNGKAITLRAAVTDALIGAHLAGEKGIGIVPIRDDATVRSARSTSTFTTVLTRQRSPGSWRGWTSP